MGRYLPSEVTFFILLNCQSNAACKDFNMSRIISDERDGAAGFIVGRDPGTGRSKLLRVNDAQENS